MIEQTIYFALGCIVAALCALMFAPIFWSRAMRLSRQRLQLQIPLSMQEIYAERDGLRAEFAVERLRLEQDVENVRTQKARDMAEIGRRTMEASRFAEDLAASQRAAAALDKTIEDLRRQLGDRDATIARVTAELAASKDLAERLRQAEQAAAAKAVADNADLVRRHDADTQMARSRHEAVEQELAAAQAALAASQDREQDERSKAGREAEAARSAERAAAGRIEALEAENAVLQSALTDARRAAGAHAGADDGGLRDSIHELGLKLADMSRDARARGETVAPSEAAVQSVG